MTFRLPHLLRIPAPPDLASRYVSHAVTAYGICSDTSLYCCPCCASSSTNTVIFFSMEVYLLSYHSENSRCTFYVSINMISLADLASAVSIFSSLCLSTASEASNLDAGLGNLEFWRTKYS